MHGAGAEANTYPQEGVTLSQSLCGRMSMTGISSAIERRPRGRRSHGLSPCIPDQTAKSPSAN